MSLILKLNNDGQLSYEEQIENLILSIEKNSKTLEQLKDVKTASVRFFTQNKKIENSLEMLMSFDSLIFKDLVEKYREEVNKVIVKHKKELKTLLDLRDERARRYTY
jgi:hypothetical protein